MKIIPAGHRALRKGRQSASGVCYLVTTTTKNREPLFLDFDLASRVCATFEEKLLLGDSKLLCWVLMPDHAHWVLQLGGTDTLSNWVCRMKTATARAVNNGRCARESVWSRAFHDRCLCDEQTVRKASRYVVANPLRAGLVDDVGNYPFWNTVWL